MNRLRAIYLNLLPTVNIRMARVGVDPYKRVQQTLMPTEEAEACMREFLRDTTYEYNVQVPTEKLVSVYPFWRGLHGRGEWMEAACRNPLSNRSAPDSHTYIFSPRSFVCHPLVSWAGFGETARGLVAPTETGSVGLLLTYVCWFN